MKRSRGVRALVAVTAGLLLAWAPGSALACAACYGQSDAPMAQGMNWGILSLLGIIVAVLGGVASFFVYLARRMASAPELAATASKADTRKQEGGDSLGQGAESAA